MRRRKTPAQPRELGDDELPRSSGRLESGYADL